MFRVKTSQLYKVGQFIVNGMTTSSNHQDRTLGVAVIGLTMLAFGISQQLNQKKWQKYIPPSVEPLLPVTPTVATRLHASINIGLGLLLLRRPASRAVRNMAGLWWLMVLPLCARQEGWQTGLRDASIAAALFSRTS
jgi:uncharacterized membrane protein